MAVARLRQIDPPVACDASDAVIGQRAGHDEVRVGGVRFVLDGSAQRHQKMNQVLDVLRDRLAAVEEVGMPAPGLSDCGSASHARIQLARYAGRRVPGSARG